MPFQYRGNDLYCEDVQVEKLAAELGTPLYVYSYQTITENFRALDKALAPLNHQIHFAVKANSNLAILRALAACGAGFDIVSAGELHRVLKAGGDPNKIIFAGVGKTMEEIELALESKIYCFNCESEEELYRIDLVAAEMGTVAPISLRVNPNVDAHTHHYISTGKSENKFGISFERALGVSTVALQFKNVFVRGVQMHIGSQITSVAPYVKAIKKMRPLVERLKALCPNLEFFDIGGGIGITYHNEKPPTPQQFADAVVPLLKPLGLKILMEPGRFLVGQSGALVTQVQYIKKTSSKKFVIVDAGMNDLIRPALYGSYHSIVPVKKTKRRPIIADIVGPVCESGDFFAKNRSIQHADPMSYLAILSAGAYGFVMASNYNSRGRPAEVLVHGNEYSVIRERETRNDLIRGETIPKWLK
ncbi:MAG: diaminopimelate decarboxylase [Verrucomicrobiae bacterium]|nr:diaminopimelate decarboxylase [Verrucomicrobiae bacterium]